MTAKTGWIIEYRAGLYRFGRLGVDAQLHDAPAGDPAEPDALVEALAEAGYSGQAAMLTIPSPWCLPASLEVASRRLARNPQALAYALEERLPLSAEDKWRHLPVDTRLVVREIAEILLERQDEAVLPVMIVARAGEFE